ncbi:hypothetical protein [Aeromicrobium sp. Sec7.5]|uniref:hypothetical protein n=1 Tax=Aeromicrobium sp. Sec7.5 TaxID=3121276 RepID=UPI002FE4F0CE
MSTDVVVLAATAVLAVVALVAAVVTVRVARSSARDRAELRAELEARRAAEERQSSERAAVLAAEALVPVPYDPKVDRRGETGDLVVRPQTAPTQTRVVDGQVFVVPTQHDVVATALSRPAIRVSVLVHGLAHALRPESRDRISALMRREFTRRRRERQRAARQAARLHTPSAAPNPGTAWVSGPDVERTR